MSEAEIVLTAQRGDALSIPARSRQPIFWIALACAALVHAGFIVGVAISNPRHIGEANGDANAIDVELIDASELKSSGTNTATAAPQVAPQPPVQAEPQKEEELAPPEPPKEEAEEPQPEPLPEPQKTAEAPPAPEPPDETPVLPDLSETPAPAMEAAEKTPPKKEEEKPVKKEEPKKEPKKEAAKPPPKPKHDAKKKHQLDLSVPLNLAMRDAMEDFGDSGAVRPPGITRSGENDRFGRDVIRALKRTMPQSYGLRSRVTIRIVLDGNGHVAKVQLLQSGGSRDLDQNIVFAARQTPYPFPPKNATLADRTFVVTYVYK
jgi:TonB family protein